MHPKRTARRLMPWAIVLTIGLLATVSGRAQPPDLKAAPPVKVDAKTGVLIVPLGGTVTFEPKELKGAPTGILVTNDNVLIARLDPDNPRRLFLTGKTGGQTQLTIEQKDLPPVKYEVLVEPDLALLRTVIKRTVPTSNVEVLPGVGNSIIVSGYVTSPQDADIVARLVNSAVGANVSNVINALQIGGVQQVQIDVVIASVDRNTLRSRGFDFAVPGRGSLSFSSVISGLLGVQTGTSGTAPTFSPSANLQLAVLPNRFFGALQALRTEGVAKFLAEPRVVTQTGRPAFFRAGGQQAILSATSGITGPGVQLVPFGTELEVVPIVYGNNMIWLDINPRITAVNQGLGITVNGATSPGFSEQSVRSTVLLESGQTFAIGGLIQTTVQATATKVPIFGDLPFVGTIASSLSYQTRESELVILVTPRLVHPMDPCQSPKRLPGQETRTPDDYELFLENVLEAPRGQRRVWNGKCYNAVYKCGPTLNQFPCAGNICTGPNGTCLPTPLSGAPITGPAMMPPPGMPAPGVMPKPVIPGGTSSAPTSPPAVLPGTSVGFPMSSASEPGIIPLPPLPPVSGSPAP